MSGIEIVMGDVEEEKGVKAAPKSLTPEEFFGQSAFRMVYQTNNFFLPQIQDLIVKGEILN